MSNSENGTAQSFRGKRVLVLMGRTPWPVDDGWRTRCTYILRGLHSLGAITTLVTFGDPTAAVPDSYRDILEAVEVVKRGATYRPSDLLRGLLGDTPFTILNYGSTEFAATVARLASSGAYELLLVEDIVMAQYASLVPGVPSWLDMHNVESHLLSRFADDETSHPRRFYARLTAEKLSRYEARQSERFSRVLLCSADDEHRLRSLASTARTSVLPNGVDTEYFRPAEPEQDDGSIVFVGSMDYHANIGGVKHFVADVLPLVLAELPNARTIIVGKNPSASVRALAAPNIVVTGTVDDVRPYLARARVVVVPLRVGGGTRLKILEAMSMQKSIVTTAVGCEGIDATTGEHVLFADSPKEFAKAVIELHRSAALRDRLGVAARQLVERRYSWEALTRSAFTTSDSTLMISGKT